MSECGHYELYIYLIGPQAGPQIFHAATFGHQPQPTFSPQTQAALYPAPTPALGPQAGPPPYLAASNAPPPYPATSNAPPPYPGPPALPSYPGPPALPLGFVDPN